MRKGEREMMAEGRKTGEERLGKEKENGRKGRRRDDGGREG